MAKTAQTLKLAGEKRSSAVTKVYDWGKHRPIIEPAQVALHPTSGPGILRMGNTSDLIWQQHRIVGQKVERVVLSQSK